MEEKFAVVVEAIASITKEFREFKTAIVKQHIVCTGKCNKNEVNGNVNNERADNEGCLFINHKIMFVW